MLTVDDYGAIRRACRDGMPIKQIVGVFRHSRNTIREVLRQAEPNPMPQTRNREAPVLGPLHAVIDQILDDDRNAPPKQRHTAMQVFRRLKDEHDYTGCYGQVRRFIRARRQTRKETFIPLGHLPGQRLEADFGHVRVDFPDGRRLIPFLVTTWAYSNAPFVLALPLERTEAILAGMLATRAAAAISRLIKDARFPVLKDFEVHDFSVPPRLSKPKVLELGRCEWIEHKYNCCLVSSHGTGKTHLAIALAQAACRRGLRVRFFTAAALVTELEKTQKQYTLDRFLGQLDRTHLLTCDELGYLSMSRGGVELLFRVFAERYVRGSVLITTNLPSSEWNQVFQGERMTAALLDRLTHRCDIFEMNGESYRFRESMKTKKARKSE